MSETRIGRRQLVRTAAGVAAGGALAVGTGVGAASAADDDHGHGLVGSWWVTHQNDPPADPEPGASVVGFAPGGLAVSNDVVPPGPVATGVWTATGARTFRATFWGSVAGPSPEESFVIRIKVRGRLRGDDTVSGTFTVTGFAPDGTTEVFSATGTFTGTRMSA